MVDGTTDLMESNSERLKLTQEVGEFLYYEADLLDERRFDEWLQILADDISYSMPLRMNVKFGELESREETRVGSEICWFDENKDTLRARVEQIKTGVHWAEEPMSRVSHVVSNVRVKAVNPPEVTVSSRFIVYRNRMTDESDLLVGRRTDTLRQEARTWKLCRRRLLLDQNVLLAKNLTVLL